MDYPVHVFPTLAKARKFMEKYEQPGMIMKLGQKRTGVPVFYLRRDTPKGFKIVNSVY